MAAVCRAIVPAVHLCREAAESPLAAPRAGTPQWSDRKRHGAATRTRAIAAGGPRPSLFNAGKRTVNDFRCKFWVTIFEALIREAFGREHGRSEHPARTRQGSHPPQGAGHSVAARSLPRCWRSRSPCSPARRCSRNDPLRRRADGESRRPPYRPTQQPHLTRQLRPERRRPAHRPCRPPRRRRPPAPRPSPSSTAPAARGATS